MILAALHRTRRRRVLLASAAGVILLSGVLGVTYSRRKGCHTKDLHAAPSAETPSKQTERGAKGQAKEIEVRTLELVPQDFEVPVSATGTLLPREGVEIVSELSRRLIRIAADEGEWVKKGAVLFELDASDLAAERKRLALQLSLARRTAQRQDELLRELVTTEAEADVARTQEQELGAAIHALDVTLAKAVIRAPFDGRLGLRNVSVGAWVTPSTPLISIEDTTQLKIDFQIPERHAAAIRPGDTFKVVVEAYPKAFEGKVLATQPSVDPRSRSLTVRGCVTAQDAPMPGSFAKVELPVVSHDALLIPPISVIPGVEGRGVFVEREGIAHLVPVTLGSRTPSQVQVLGGLNVGDRVIVTNLLRLREGIAVDAEATSPASETEQPAPTVPSQAAP